MNAKLKYKSKKIKIVFFDIDDTLRIKATGYIPDSIKTVFKQLKEKGILTGIASGRGIFGVVPELKALQPDFFVTLNGSYIEDKAGKVIAQTPIARNVVETYIAWTKEVGIDFGLVGSHEAALSTRTPLIDEAIDIIYPNLPIQPDLYQDHNVYQMWTFEDIGDSLQLPKELEEHLRLVRWHPHSSDVVLTNGSKASGVATVVEHLGLKPENVMVFGDELNDLELFDYAGISIAMGISHEKIKAKADFVTKKVEEDKKAEKTVQVEEKPKTAPKKEKPSLADLKKQISDSQPKTSNGGFSPTADSDGEEVVDRVLQNVTYSNGLVSGSKMGNSEGGLLVDWNDSNRAPEFPQSARASGKHGKLKIKLKVDKAGNVLSYVIVEGSGVPEIDASVEKVVGSWRVKLLKKGKPVNGTFYLNYNFNFK